MRRTFLLSCLMVASGLADAALVDRDTGQPFRFWVDAGHVRAGTINAVGNNTQAIVRGQGNIARNSVGLISGGSIVRGQVHINAVARGTSAVAIGSGNVATNDIGTIGGW